MDKQLEQNFQKHRPKFYLKKKHQTKAPPLNETTKINNKNKDIQNFLPDSYAMQFTSSAFN